MTNVVITWKAFGNKPERKRYISSVKFQTEFEVEHTYDALKLLNVIYHVTNTYSGELWNLIEPLLSPNRTHTALSVGDEVQIGDNVYICADFGWVKSEEADIKYLSNEYGEGAIFSVSRKAN